MTQYIYPSAIVAVARAFSAPRPRVLSTLGMRTARDHDALTTEEHIAQDGMVQQIAIRHCSQRSVMVFRACWESEHDMAEEAMRWHAEAFQRPGRAPPVRWGMSVVLRWSGRHREPWARPLRGPASDRGWAKTIGVDRRTVGGWRRELRGALDAAIRDGLKVMGQELRTRGLIPDGA